MNTDMVLSSSFLHEIYNYALTVIPEEFFKCTSDSSDSTDSTFSLGDFSHTFSINGHNFEILADKLNDCEYCSIKMYNAKKDHTTYLMTVGNVIKIQLRNGLSLDKEIIFKNLLSFTSLQRIYLYSSSILFQNRIYKPEDISADLLFNLSTVLNDKELQCFRFLSELKNPVNYIFINTEETKWYQVINCETSTL